MNYNEELQLLKKELYGIESNGSIDGYQNQIGMGNFDKDKFNKILTQFKNIAQNAKKQDPVLNEILGHYINFAIDTATLLLSQKNDDYSEIVKELENIF